MQVNAQCPPADGIQKQIIQQKLAPEITSRRKLELLIDYRNKMVQCGFRKDSTYFWVLLQIAFEYYQQKNFSESINYRLQYLAFNKPGLNDSLTNEVIIKQYMWLFLCYDSLNNGSAKRKAADSCIEISERLRYHPNSGYLRCLLDRVQYFFDIGEYRFCINDADKCEKAALIYLQTNRETDYFKFGNTVALSSFHWRINALLGLKDFITAEQLLANKIDEYKSKGLKNYLALTYSELADVLMAKGSYELALSSYNLSLKNYKETKDNLSCKQTLNNIGQEIYFRHFHNYDKAIFCFKNAIQFSNNSDYFIREDSIESLNIYARIANIFIQKGLPDSASFYFQLAFNQLRKGATIDNILYSTPDEFVGYKKLNYLTEFLISYGDAQRKKYDVTKNNLDLEKAITIFDKVDKFLARINVSQFEQESKLFWRSESRRLYEHAIEACYLLKDADKAFYFFERSRAVLLNIQLREQNLLGNTDISRLEEIKKKITALNNAIVSLPDNSKEKYILQDSLHETNDRMYSITQLIKTSYPLYYQNMDTAMLSIHDVRNKLLNDHQAIIEMFSGDSAVYSLLITGEKATISKIDKNDFTATVNSYTSFLSNYELLNKNFSTFRETAHHLYDLVLQNNPSPKGRIVISPEGYYFPFESLISDNSGTEPVYFIVDHAVSYTYSARYLLNNFVTATDNAAGNFLGIAPVNYSASFHLVNLSGSDNSLRKIQASISNSEILTLQNATRNNFLEQFRKYLAIQLYTHASDSSDRQEPIIYFSDSALYLSELVSAAKPKTELIILSACETGNGKLYQGEGVFSFNRAFASLGIPSSITNLWSINNKSTYAITELFYKNLADGLPMDIALQKAKLSYMNQEGDAEKQLPYFWAAPVLVGKSGVIPIEKPFQWKWVLLAASLVIISYVSWRLIKINKRKINQVPGKAGTAS